MVAQTNGIAFSVDADAFIEFARSLPNDIERPEGGPLTADDLVDFDLCWAFDFLDPWGNRFELNCYDHDRVRIEFVETDSVASARKWPAELYGQYLGRSERSDTTRDR